MGQVFQETSNLKDKAREVSKASPIIALGFFSPEPLTFYNRQNSSISTFHIQQKEAKKNQSNGGKGE